MNTLAKLVLHWAHSTFGDIALNPVERTLRIVEEAVELAQADDCPKDKLHAIIERAYSRPKDEVYKEMGGLLATVYARCGLEGWDPDMVLSAEVTRILSKPRKHWADKHDAKAADGTVTGLSSHGTYVPLRPTSLDDPNLRVIVCRCSDSAIKSGVCLTCGGLV